MGDTPDGRRSVTSPALVVSPLEYAAPPPSATAVPATHQEDPVFAGHTDPDEVPEPKSRKKRASVSISFESPTPPAGGAPNVPRVPATGQALAATGSQVFAQVKTIGGHLWHGRPVQAFQAAGRAQQALTPTGVLTRIVFAVNAVLIGVLSTQAVITVYGRVEAATLSYLYQLYVTQRMDTGRFTSGELRAGFDLPLATMGWLLLANLVLAAVYLAARVVAIHLVMLNRGATTTLRDTATLFATPQLMWTVPWAVLALVWFVPGTVGDWLFLILGTGSLLAYLVFTQNAIYLGMNRAHAFAKSPLVPYAIVTAISLLVVVAAAVGADYLIMRGSINTLLTLGIGG